MKKPTKTSLVFQTVSLISIAFASTLLAQSPLAAIPPEVLSNSRVSNKSESPVILTDIRSEKLFYSPEEKVTANLELWNRGNSTLEVQLRTWIEKGLDEQIGQQSSKIKLTAGERKSVAFSWAGKSLGIYGKEIVANVLEGNKVLATGSEIFSSAASVWDAGIAGAHPVAFTATLKTEEDAIKRVNTFRNCYLNSFEKFFWAPDDFAEMTPQIEQWFSGQARYHENKERLKNLNDAGLKMGVLPTTYGKSIGSGPAARDFIRENPEMVFGFGGVMNYAPDIEELAKWQIDSKPYWQSTAWAMYNMNDPAVVQHGIQEIIDSTRMFGWVGVRFDGHFQARTGLQRVGNEFRNFSPDDADKQTAANQKELKKQVLKAFPNFIFGYNFAETHFDRRLQSQLREALELTKDGGMIMDEYAGQATGSAHPFTDWKAWAHMLVREAEQVRRCGGHLFPILSPSPAVRKYQTVFTLAAGAHPYFNGGISENSEGFPLNYTKFATRYGNLLWDPSIRNVWNPLGLVVIPSSIMWEDYVREQQVNSNHRRLIVHLINPIIQQTAADTFALEKEQDRREKRRAEIRANAAKDGTTADYSELDSLAPIEIFPAPKKDIPVRIIRQAVGKEWAVSGVHLLNPESGVRQPLPVDDSDPYFWQVNIPEISTWVVLVIDLKK